MRKKVGILGGTFDPPHYGHLVLAEQVLDQTEVNEIWFMPTNVPPHKKNEGMATKEQRLKMAELAIKDQERFIVSDVEFERSGPSYTIDTIAKLHRAYPDDTFFFIIGGDMVNQLEDWYKIEQLKKLVTFIVAERPNDPLSHEQKMNLSSFMCRSLNWICHHQRFVSGLN
ncbi:nicotinate-nucleotide adenylyltransferase [Geomicrobium sp. JCM 19038]|uniref:nicotinate-nucleotide adenylyltransferase n=1 Tax=Geomicrobium sp. JCM 19038 TaxID=1460635 RepID=UPI000A4E8C48|nr:nicotinate-nucleotide adenylyltransferase [Geomicrobium sp. JCM 19038]